MNSSVFCRSDGEGRATTRNTRGLTFSVSALMVPPLPAASRPSKMMITFSFSALTHSCRWQSSSCSLRNSFSYSFRFIFEPASSFAMRNVLRLIDDPLYLAVPAQRNGDVAGHAAGKIDDLVADAIAARLQIVAPELVDFLRYPAQRLFPALFHLVDGAALVAAQRIREAVDLHLGQAVANGALDYGRSELHLLLLRQTRRLAEPVDQGMLFGLGRRQALGMLVRLLGLFKGRLFLDFLRAGDQIVDLGHAKPLLKNRSVLVPAAKGGLRPLPLP